MSSWWWLSPPACGTGSFESGVLGRPFKHATVLVLNTEAVGHIVVDIGPLQYKKLLTQVLQHSILLWGLTRRAC